MRKICLVFAFMLLAGCEPSFDVDNGDWKLPSDLKDCHVIELSEGGVSSSKALIIKCPDGYIGSSINYQSGKHRYSTSTIVM